ncbi:hypothetical protein EDC04DRAFT_2655930, partial [Pisolithus marmoratus]
PPEVPVDKGKYIEQWLSDAEGKLPVETLSTTSGYAHLHKYTSKSQNYQTKLIALSETSVNDSFALGLQLRGGI